MPEWQGKSRGNKLGYSIFVTVCKSAGLRPAYLLLRFVALYYVLFSKNSSVHIYQYFRHRQSYGKLKALKFIYTNYYRFGQTLLDKIVVMAGIENKFTYHFEGEENLLDMVRKNKGGILLSGHVGNWEVAGHFLKRLDTTIHVVMFDGEHQQIKNYLTEVTGKRKFNVIIVRDDLSHVYAIGEALQKNELVCMHADRFLENNKTKVNNFLGAPALFPTGPFVLAAGFNVPVSVVFAFKETGTHYHFFGSKPIIRSENESKPSFTERLMKIFVKEMEEKVKMYPEQWFNYYNFWMNQ
jgi:predicted LPLAT superfamily acyltransferase